MAADQRQQWQDFLAAHEFVLLDGAMGTQLQARGISAAECPESWLFSHPEEIVAIHRDYLEAGSDVIFTNTFGASAHKLEDQSFSSPEAIRRAVQLGRQAIAASGRPALLGVDIGPLGRLLAPAGDLAFTEALEDFRIQVQAARAAEADLLAIETMTDLYELKAALLACRETAPELPVLCSMSFTSSGRTFNGCDIASYVTLAESLGASTLGLNCSEGPEQLAGLAQELLLSSGRPVSFKPNAGLPDPRTGRYALDPAAFVQEILPLAAAGVKCLGGCCGTSPAHIAALAQALAGQHWQRPPQRAPRYAVCSGVKTVLLDHGPLLVGEYLTPTGKPALQQALQTGNLAAYARVAVEEEEQGADILDVNCGYAGVDEVACLPEAVQAVQAVSRLPIQIDSSKAAAVEAALRVVNGKAIVNSVSAKARSLERVLPLVHKYGAAVIILPLDDQGIPRTAAARLAVIERVIQMADSLGIPRTDLLVDGLVLTASAEPQGAEVCLETVRMVKERWGLPTIIGLSNISFGLPARRRLNQVFYAQALSQGLDLAIANVGHGEILETRAAHRALHQQDPGDRDYLHFFQTHPSLLTAPGRTAPAAAAAVAPAGEEEPLRQASPPVRFRDQQEAGLFRAVLDGLDSTAGELCAELLQRREPLALIQEILVPALDLVGDYFASGRYFLPQLLQSAKAAQAAFDLVRRCLRAAAAADPNRTEESQRPPVILATVEGDVHDIGKNIAKALLENYGFPVLDLGKDVSPEIILQAAKRSGSPLIGLSALMTSALPAMVETIARVKSEGLAARVMVSGAVVTEAYAREIGADFYCADANHDVEVARQLYAAQA